MEMNKDLRDDLHEAIDQAQDLLKQAKEVGGEKAEELQDQANKILENAKKDFSRYYQRATEEGTQIACNVNDCVHENPWRAVGIAAVAGIVLGAILARK